MAKKNNESLVYGILSLVFGVIGLIVFAIILDPLGILFGCLGLSKNKKDTISIIGLTLSAVGLFLYIIMLLFSH